MTSRVGGLEISAPLGLAQERELYPVITQGREAARRLAQGHVDARTRLRLQRAREAGQEAESQLLRATLGLVRTRVHERGYRFGDEELEAAGVEGLVNALHRFDPARGVRFATYANYWIVKMVNQAIQSQVGISDAEMRLVLAFEKLQRAATGPLGPGAVARTLGVPVARAREVMGTARDVAARRFLPARIAEDADVHAPPEPSEAPPWVIEALKRLCGEDFDAFWQSSFRTTSLDELARARGMSRQGLAKRLERCRRAVLSSPDANRLQEWFDRQ